MQGGNTFSLGEGCPGVTLGGDMGWEGSRGVGKGGGSCEECVGQSEQWNWQGAHTIQPSSLVFQSLESRSILRHFHGFSMKR